MKTAYITRKIIADHLGLSLLEIDGAKSIYELNGDSLDAIEIVMAIEDHFEFELSDEETFPYEARPLSEFIAFVAGKVAGRTA